MVNGSDDRRGVHHTASVLDVSEFDVFSLAYQHWFGRPAAVEDVSSEFKRYLQGKAIPPWVRDFIRRVNALSREQRLALSLELTADPKPALVSPPESVGYIRTYVRSRLSLRAREIIIGSLALVGMGLVVFMLIYLAAATQQAAPVPCTLPPCY